MENSAKTSQAEETGKNSSFFSLAISLLSDLPDRSQEIVKKRFGLLNNKPETLEKIGRDHGITRERVRQIISDAVKRVMKKKNEADFKKAEDKLVWTIGENSGIIEENTLLEKLSKGNQKEANAIVFFGTLTEKINLKEEKGIIKKSWFLSKENLEKAKEVISATESILSGAKELLEEKKIVEKISEKLGKKYDSSEILDCLAISENIKKNRFGKWGMADWKEVNPKGTKERIYLIMKEKGSPLHFTEIAKLIDENKLSKKKAHPQTVHNELIKDERFVLIGRGIYALREWGYERGTIKDVLQDILKKSGRPLKKEEIMEEVLRVRKVKKATIMINLNNSKSFVREKNLYTLKK